jgi:DNA repair photolyase
MFSGVTDCYQPVERHLRLTRQCIEVAAEARQPLAIVTKNALVTRDLDLLEPMARQRLAKVAISLTSLDQKLTRVMEPRTSSPAARLRTIQELTQAGVPVHVMLAPLIPGLTDHEIPALLKAAAEAGARTASYILLRLPMTVEPVFLEWLERTQPQHRDRVESRIRSTRGGELYQSKFVERMRGTGEIAEQIRRTFHVFAKKLGLDQTRGAELDVSQFRPPTPSSGQKWLFD